MRSTQGMFDLISEVRKETNRLFDRIELYQIYKIKAIYHRVNTKKEFKEELKAYLQW